MNSLLLDTHILIWLINGDKTLPKHLIKKIQEVCKDGYLCISAISIWEISLLQLKGKISIKKPICQWVDELINLSYIKIINVDHKIALESNALPYNFHNDPADRIIVATARIHDIGLVSVDQQIVEYGNLYNAVNVLY